MIDIKTEAKLLKTIGKLFTAAEKPMSEANILKEKAVYVMDPANVCMIVAKTKSAKKILAKFIEADTELPYKSIPNLDYTTYAKKDVNICKYSMEYLKPILAIMDLDTYGSIELESKKDYPMRLTNEHFQIILAPRVEND